MMAPAVKLAPCAGLQQVMGELSRALRARLSTQIFVAKAISASRALTFRIAVDKHVILLCAMAPLLTMLRTYSVQATVAQQRQAKNV
jgi:hypothetical protein